jgi:transcription elongation factor GreA
MAIAKIPMTVSSYNLLQEELKRLKTFDRQDVIQAIATAREYGDLSENAEYHAARERQGFIEGRIVELESKLSHAEIIDASKLNGTTVKFGATVTLIDEETNQESTYQIVGVDEASIEKGLLSLTSPLARAMIGKEQGNSIDVMTPSGHRFYEIARVEYK